MKTSPSAKSRKSGTRKTQSGSSTTHSGARLFEIEYEESVLKDDIPDLPKAIRHRVRSAIEQKIASDPVRFGKPLRYSLKGHRRIRVGDYRIVYRVDVDRWIVRIVAIKHRKDIYED